MRRAGLLVSVLAVAGVLAGCSSPAPTDYPYADGQAFAVDEGSAYWEWVPPDRAESICASDYTDFIAGEPLTWAIVSGSDFRIQWVKGCVAGSRGPISANTGSTGNTRR